MSSSLPLKVIISHLRELAELKVPTLSEAANTVALLYRTVKQVHSDQDEFEELSTKSAKLLHAVINSLREKRQRDLDDNSKSNIDTFVGVVEKVQDLALENSTRDDWIAFWYSDMDKTEGFRGELDACLRAFGFKSFDNLQAEPKQPALSQPVKKIEKDELHAEPLLNQPFKKIEKDELHAEPKQSLLNQPVKKIEKPESINGSNVARTPTPLSHSASRFRG